MLGQIKDEKFSKEKIQRNKVRKHNAAGEAQKNKNKK
jgi:hypothetical protein